jgi:tellurite resistance protein TehA-like permease
MFMNIVGLILAIVFALAFFASPIMYISTVFFGYGNMEFWSMIGVCFISFVMLLFSVQLLD